MTYPVIVHKDENSIYGITVPDFPGVFSGGQTLAEALGNVQDAVDLYFEDMEQPIIPHPSTLEFVMSLDEARNGAILMVEIEPRVPEYA